MRPIFQIYQNYVTLNSEFFEECGLKLEIIKVWNTISWMFFFISGIKLLNIRFRSSQIWNPNSKAFEIWDTNFQVSIIFDPKSC